MENGGAVQFVAPSLRKKQTNKKTQCQEEMLTFRMASAPGFLPELHTFGIRMPECSKKEKGDLSFAYKQ